MRISFCKTNSILSFKATPRKTTVLETMCNFQDLRKTAKSLFSNDDDRICRPTKFAVQRGAWKSDSTGGCIWWLRSPGSDGSDYAALVYNDGFVYSYGCYVDYSRNAVRPALWLNL